MSAPRILLIAEAANPEWSSVPQVGWSHARALAEVADVHLVTQIRNREALLRAGLAEGRDFTALDSEAVAGPLFRLGSRLRGGPGRGWTTMAALTPLTYSYFESLLWKRFAPRLRAGEFDLVHRITPLSPVTPSPIAARCRRLAIPFILGPLNGGVPWPRGFERERRREGEWLSFLRPLYKLIPGGRATFAHASALLVASRETERQLAPAWKSKCFYLPENAVDPARFAPPPPRPARSALEAVFAGRLVPCKGVDLLLEAAAPLLREGKLKLTIVGDGPERPALERLIGDRGLAAGVRMTGWVDPARVQEHFRTADLLAFPSIREFGGAVALEAMACGAVPVVMDYGGPAELVTERSGFRIPMGPRDRIIERLRETLTSITARPEGLERLREAGLERIRTLFTWQAKARQVREIYDWVLGRRKDKPDFAKIFRGL